MLRPLLLMIIGARAAGLTMGKTWKVFWDLGGFAAFDFVGPNPAYRYVDEEGRPTVDELNKGAFSYRRMKWALGHFEVTSRGILDWIE